jgi:hypothetical protein
MIQTRGGAVSSFIAPEGRERETWSTAERALDQTLNEGAWGTLQDVSPNACRTADPAYNVKCLVPARLAALKRLARGDWPWPYRGTGWGSEASAEAQVVLAAEIVRQAGLEAWELDPAIYQAGGAWEPVVIGVSVPGGGVVNVRLNADGTYQDPPELKARAIADQECNDLEREAAQVLPWNTGQRAEILERLEACREVVRQMPFPTSQDVPGITWTEPEPEEERDDTTGDVVEDASTDQDQDGEADPVLEMTPEEEAFFEELRQYPEAWDRYWHPWRYAPGDVWHLYFREGEPEPEPEPTTKRKRSLEWLWWTLGGVAAAGTVIAIARAG